MRLGLRQGRLLGLEDLLPLRSLRLIQSLVGSVYLPNWSWVRTPARHLTTMKMTMKQRMEFAQIAFDAAILKRDDVEFEVGASTVARQHSRVHLRHCRCQSKLRVLRQHCPRVGYVQQCQLGILHLQTGASWVACAWNVGGRRGQKVGGRSQARRTRLDERVLRWRDSRSSVTCVLTS